MALSKCGDCVRPEKWRSKKLESRAMREGTLHREKGRRDELFPLDLTKSPPGTRCVSESFT